MIRRNETRIVDPLIDDMQTTCDKTGENLFVVRAMELKFDVYGKRQTAKIKLLPSAFNSLYSWIKIFVFAVNSKRHFPISVWFI